MHQRIYIYIAAASDAVVPRSNVIYTRRYLQ